jgi:hypothetical protein
MKTILFLTLLLPLSVSAQVNDDFADGDFMHDPVWTGDTAYWEVADRKLQSRLPPAGAADEVVFHLSTPSTSVENTTWEFWVQLRFNTSRSNYVDVYLVSDEEDPRCGSGHCNASHGYFVRIGTTQDNISLYRRDSATDVLLINGSAGVTGHSNNMLKIKVHCNNAHSWTLYTDASGTGQRYLREGAAVDSTYMRSAYFSIVVYQNGKTVAGKHFFDDIQIRPFLADTLKPVLSGIFPVDSHHIDLLFSETMSVTSAENILNYPADGGLVAPGSAVSDENDPRLVHLYFETAFEQTKTYHLNLSHVSDLSGNETDTSVSFVYYDPGQYDVVIDELFPDPAPSRGLPEYEFAEIKNRSPYPVNLSGWAICDPARCAVFPRQMLAPDSFLIICDQTAETAFSRFGKTTGVPHFPSLNNTGDVLTLYNSKGKTIHAVAYDKSWYHDDAKDDGGWSLEMKNVQFPCRYENNWSASESASGGTPGRENSINASSADEYFLALEYVRVLDSVNIVAHFNLGLDSILASQPGQYSLSDAGIETAQAESPLFQDVRLHLSHPLQKRKVYTLDILHLTGCGNIPAGLDHIARFGMPEKAGTQDVVINEILFNPRGESKDFVEVYNHSPKIIDISTLQLANRNRENAVASIKSISPVPRYLFPNEYAVITEDKQDLMQQYFCKKPENITEAASLPPYPNTSGNVILLSASGEIIDEVHYDENEHAMLLHSDDGVSLERADDRGKSNDPHNWHSASSLVGYATPTYRNSQAADSGMIRAFSVDPKIFSPDGDGMDDVAGISYMLPDHDYHGEILIFDANGHLARHLIQNALFGTHGTIVWDGRDDRMRLMPTGVYIIYIRIFNLQGGIKSFKIPVVLVKKSL